MQLPLKKLPIEVVTAWRIPRLVANVEVELRVRVRVILSYYDGRKYEQTAQTSMIMYLPSVCITNYFFDFPETD